MFFKWAKNLNPVSGDDMLISLVVLNWCFHKGTDPVICNNTHNSSFDCVQGKNTFLHLFFQN